MNQEEHLRMARELLRRADRESRDGGNELVAAELLWGAFAHCLITVALNDGLPHDSHGAFKRIVSHLDTVQGGNTWSSRFGSAERLHFHFYHGRLTASEFETHKQDTTEGVAAFLLAL